MTTNNTNPGQTMKKRTLAQIKADAIKALSGYYSNSVGASVLADYASGNVVHVVADKDEQAANAQRCANTEL